MSKNKLSFKIIKDNYYLLKMIITNTPMLLIWGCAFQVSLSFSWFFEHVIGFRFIMETVEKGGNFKNIVYCILAIWALCLLQHKLQIFYDEIIRPKYEPILNYKIKKVFYDKAQSIDLACYDNPEYYNELIWCVDGTPAQAMKTLNMLRNFLNGFFNIILSGSFFFMYDKAGIVFVLVSFVGNQLLQTLLNKKMFLFKRETSVKERKRNYFNRVFYLRDYAKEIRLNNMSNMLKDKFSSANDDVIKTINLHSKSILFFSFIKQYFFNSFIFDSLYIIYLVIQITITKNIEFSSFVSLQRSSIKTKDSFLTVSNTLVGMHENSLYVDKIKRFLNTESQIISTNNPISIPNEINTLEFKNVSFGYNNKDVLNNISFKISAGEKIAIVGYNGAGKTTLIKLMMRLYDVNTGEILLNGINIKEYDITEYRKLLATVFQNFQMYAFMLSENVKMDNYVNDEEQEIVSALHKAGFEEKLNSLHNNLNTQIKTEFSEQGVELSGGDAQKVAISRAFFKKSEIVVLDEPSSALDPLSEYHFYRSVSSVLNDKMVVSISHRLASTKTADKIYLIKDGKVSESGSHNELMKNDMDYARMFNLQAKYYNVLLD